MCLHYMEMASKDKKKKNQLCCKNRPCRKKNCDDLVVKKESDFPKKKIWGGACVPRISVLDSLMALLLRLVRIGEI